MQPLLKWSTASILHHQQRPRFSRKGSERFCNLLYDVIIQVVIFSVQHLSNTLTLPKSILDAHHCKLPGFQFLYLTRKILLVPQQPSCCAVQKWLRMTKLPKYCLETTRLSLEVMLSYFSIYENYAELMSTTDITDEGGMISRLRGLVLIQTSSVRQLGR